MKKAYTGPRPVCGIGYQLEGGGSVAHPKIFRQWRKMLEQFLEHDRGYNTINLAASWECFDNYRDWYLDHAKNFSKLKTKYLVFLAPEFLPKRVMVSGKPKMLVSPKYGPKTCTLSITKPPTWRKSYWKEMRVRNKTTNIVEDKMVERKGTPNAQRFKFFIPVDTALYQRKKAAQKQWSKSLAERDEERERVLHEKLVRGVARDKARLAKRAGASRYSKGVVPAQELQRKQLAKAKAQEASRLVGLDDVELRIKQRGIYRGLGYIGEGPYETRIKKVKTRAYNRWLWILDRCYKNVDRREDTNMYLGYRLGKKFLCFQDFAKWFESVDRPECSLPTFIVKPNSKGKLVLGPKNTKLMF